MFTGDTVFVGGCGRFFEGTAQEMVEAFRRFGELPDDTKVYVGHEYTVANLTWGSKIEHENGFIKEKLI